MLISFHWLQELIPHCPQPEELMEKLSLHSVEVESVRRVMPELGNVVVGEVMRIWQHPNADALSIASINVGESQPRQIVFGRKLPLRIGDKIPVALAPTMIPGNVEIYERLLRGQKSQGMCCVNQELHLFDNSDRIYHVSQRVKNGTPLVNILVPRDIVLEIDNKTMTHRSDLFNHIGIGREIAAVFGLRLQLPKDVMLPKVSSSVSFKIASSRDCPRYYGLRVRVRVGKTPEHIRERLESVGISSINNIVDIMNFVMVEWGQPLHAFDARFVDGTLHIRRAHQGERLTTLDGIARTLSQEILVIADRARVLALAGMMGGMESRVREDTQEIILEAASFDAQRVRIAAKEQGIRTESVIRYEKGLSPAFVGVAVRRAFALLQEYADAECLAMKDSNPHPRSLPPVTLSKKLFRRLTGVSSLDTRVAPTLKRLGFDVAMRTTAWRVTPPWWRSDLHIPEDIVEEAIRIMGLDRVPMQMLSGRLEIPAQDPELLCIERLRDVLRTVGMTETYHYSFYGRDVIERCNLTTKHVEIANPLSSDGQYVRTSLVPLMLPTLVTYMTHRRGAIFEIGHVMFSDAEERQCAMVIAGDQSLRRLRGIIDVLMERFHISFITIPESSTKKNEAHYPMFVDGTYMRFLSHKKVLGTLGVLDRTVARQSGIDDTEVAIAVFSLSSLASSFHTAFSIRTSATFPTLSLDIAIVVDDHVSWHEIDEIIIRHGGTLLQSRELFDVYRGIGIPEGRKSFAMHLIFQSKERTLEMHELEQWRGALMQELRQSHGALLRGEDM